MNPYVAPIVTGLAAASSCAVPLAASGGSITFAEGVAIFSTFVGTVAADGLFKAREVVQLRRAMLNRGIAVPQPHDTVEEVGVVRSRGIRPARRRGLTNNP